MNGILPNLKNANTGFLSHTPLLVPSCPGLKSNGLAHTTQQAQDVADAYTGFCGSLREGNHDQDQPASTL